MGSRTSKGEFVMNIGHRDFPRHLLMSLCEDGGNYGNKKLVLSMRAASLLGSLLEQLSRVQVPDDEEEDDAENVSQEQHTILLSDGNNYQIDINFFKNFNRLRCALAEVKDLVVNHSDGRTLQDYLDLSPFENVQTLTLIDLPVHLVHYLKLLRPTLQSIHVHRCVDDMKKLFESCGGDQAFPALWTRLAVVDLRWNNLTTVDDSMHLLPFLHTLDLSNNRLTDLRGLELLTAIQVLNLSYNCITSMPSLMPSCQGNLRVLLIRFNKVSTLDGIEKFCNLINLDASNNNILYRSQLLQLKPLRYLAKLNVRNNPFEAVHKVKRKQLLEYLNVLVPIDFELNGRLLTSKENYILRKVPVSRMPASQSPMTLSLVNTGMGPPTGSGAPAVAGLVNGEDASNTHNAWMEASVESPRHDMATGGSEADVSSSDAEGYLANSLSALARQTRHHLDHVRGRYGKNWLVNWNQSEMGRNIPSPPSTLLRSFIGGQADSSATPTSAGQDGALAPRPVPDVVPAIAAQPGDDKDSDCRSQHSRVSTVTERSERADSAGDAVDGRESAGSRKTINRLHGGQLMGDGDEEDAEDEAQSLSYKDAQERIGEEDEDSQIYVSALSELGTPARAPSSPSKSDTKTETSELTVYPLKWEHEEEEVTDMTIEGSHYVVTPVDKTRPDASGADQRCMLVIGERYCQTCCLTTGQSLETLELRLLTSARREADGRTLTLGFRYAQPGLRSRCFRFAEAADCERCHAEFARQLLSEPAGRPAASAILASAGLGMGVAVSEPRANAMHCFRCRNRVRADQLARVMEVEPSTGERVLVPACPHCGYRALAEDSEDEAPRSGRASTAGKSPRSGGSSGQSSVSKSDRPPDEALLNRRPSPRLSASGYSSPSSLRPVSCDWIKFDHSDFTEFDHQIKLHFALHVLQSDKEECRIMIKCHGTPYNRADVFECVVLFTNFKYYFFKWKYHESQTVAKCLTLNDKIDLRNLVRIRSGPCYQWLMLDFNNAKRCLLFPGDPVSSCRFLQQLAEVLGDSVIDFESEEEMRRDFCAHSLSALDQDSGELTLAHFDSKMFEEEEDEEDLGNSVRMWVCRSPRSKYSSSTPITSLSMWTGRESKRDWCFLILTSLHLFLFELEYQMGVENPQTKLVFKWNIADVSGVKQGRDGVTLFISFFRQKGVEAEKDPKFKNLPIVLENEIAVKHFLSALQELWEPFYGIPLQLK